MPLVPSFMALVHAPIVVPKTMLHGPLHMPTLGWSAIASVVSLLIAFVAAFRPELQRLLKPRKLNILLADNLLVEIGFTGFGPTVGLLGIIENEHVQSLIRKLRLRVIRLDDGTEFLLSPMLNRQRAINRTLVGGEEGRGTIWLPFLIEADAATPFDILFRYEEATHKLTNVGNDLQREWPAFVLGRVAAGNPAALADADPAIAQAKIQAFTKACFDVASNEEFYKKARTTIAEQLIWTSGEYSCTLEAEVQRSKRKVAAKFRFSLADSDIATLESNTTLMIGIACKQIDPATQFSFAFASLRTS